ncbi:ComEC/Rec2 family competence protein [Iodidimonas gelatinilytica]|uniref:ComEC/Rec2 family competence protein n=1 Tax=Iodidimonas gelatinilytica TaxID=1236966 RepID=UPI0012305A37|nr:ComEC/Rec2 family competence protein [Iodidimonas gelatinilytica]
MTKSPVHIAVSRAVDHVAGFYHPLEIKRILEESILSEREHWLLWTPVFLALGIGGYFLLPIEPPGLVVILGLCVAFAAVVLSQPGIRLAFIALMIFMSGLGLAQWRNDRVAAPQIIDGSHSFSVEGTVEAVEPQDNGHVRILLDALKIKTLALEDTPQRVRITVRTDSHDVTAGDRVSLRAILSPPPDPVAPYAFDFARDSWFKRIGGVGFAVTDLAILERPTTRSLTNRVNGLRQYIAHRTTMRLDNRAGGIAAALLTGLRGYMAEDDVEAMRIAGLAHLLAISGLHLGLVASTAFFLIRLGAAAIPAIALRFDTRKAAAIMAWLVAFAYFWLAGATIPTQRAFLMISIVLLALLIGRQPISLRVVALSALLILIATPEALLSVSFQMSFAAVTALVAAYEVLAPKLAPWRRRAGFGKRTALYFLGVVLTTLIAEAAIAPFSAYHFNQLTSYGLIANLVAVPLMAFVVMPLGLLALLLMPFGGDGPVLDLMALPFPGF